MPLRRTFLAGFLALALVGAARPLIAQEGSAPPEVSEPTAAFVIPPGQDQLLSDMLGMGQALPAGCKFTDGKVERSMVIATYECQGATVVVDLRHPSEAPAGAVSTKRFAVSVRSGSAPAGLVDAIVERVRAREGEFEWKETKGPARSPMRWVLAAAVAVLLLAVVWFARRSRARPKAETP